MSSGRHAADTRLSQLRVRGHFLKRWSNETLIVEAPKIWDVGRSWVRRRRQQPTAWKVTEFDLSDLMGNITKSQEGGRVASFNSRF